MEKYEIIDGLSQCLSLISAAEIALGNRNIFENGEPVENLLGIVREKLDKCIEALDKSEESEK